MHKRRRVPELQYTVRKATPARAWPKKLMAACPAPCRGEGTGAQPTEVRTAARWRVALLSPLLRLVGVSLLLLNGAFAVEQPVAKTQTTQNQAPQTQQIDPAVQNIASTQTAAPHTRNTVCQSAPGKGPEMVILPPGSFMMGGVASDPDNEKPAHTVNIDYVFALGRCEVTVAEYRHFVEMNGKDTGAEAGELCFAFDPLTAKHLQVPGVSWQAQGFAEQQVQEQHPAVCISWDDAIEYVQWLNKESGISGDYAYRIPTEAEFEYALRSGNQDSYPWGGASQCNYSNAADQSMPDWLTSEYAVAACPDAYPWVAPVGSFPPNPYGLFDVSGNVSEWTSDCWHEDYERAPDNGVAWDGTEFDGSRKLSASGDCSRRMLRGGSWLDESRHLRSAFRYGDVIGLRSNVIGFRLARTLGPVRTGRRALAE